MTEVTVSISRASKRRNPFFTLYSSFIILPPFLPLSSPLVKLLLFFLTVFSPLLFLVLLSKSFLLLSLSNVHPSISIRFSPSFDVPFWTKEESQAGPHGGGCNEGQHDVGLAASVFVLLPRKMEGTQRGRAAGGC